MSSRVLIVDDSLTVRMDLDEALSASGFETALGVDLRSARAALAAQAFSLVVLDLLLPDGDGLELLQEIKTAANPIPVMLLSSEADVRDRIRGIQTGADEYVGKPYDVAYVVARARELVRRAEPAVESASVTVLVIDDSATSRAEMQRVLEACGFVVLTAETGEEGLRIAADRRPSAVIVDGVLPGIDGPTVVRRLRSDTALRRIPCVLLTGSDTAIDEFAALDAGADIYIRKEEDSSLIVARLTALLRSASASLSVRGTGLLGPKKILAVDDSETYLQTLAEQLRLESYDVVLARSGEQALELLAVEPVDCILLDLMMPGISGEDTCLRIKATPGLRDVPLIMLTACDERSAMIRGINAGADDYIPKSSAFEVLRARLRAQLRRKQFEDENREIREELVRKAVEAREARAARELAAARAELMTALEQENAELAEANVELEAYSYSISHDLRAPLRAIDGFSRMLMEDHAGAFDAEALETFHAIRAATTRMRELIEDLLQLSKVSRKSMEREDVSLSGLAKDVVHGLERLHGTRRVASEIEPELIAAGDRGLLRIVLENLLGNAWKFTAPRKDARVTFGRVHAEPGPGGAVYYVRDNGVGFDAAYAGKLFCPFQRLHGDDEFEGTGIGLAIVQRIIRRHGGRVWAEGAVGKGAAVYFTLRAGPDPRPAQGSAS